MFSYILVKGSTIMLLSYAVEIMIMLFRLKGTNMVIQGVTDCLLQEINTEIIAHYLLQEINMEGLVIFICISDVFDYYGAG